MVHEFATVGEDKGDVEIGKKARELGNGFVNFDHYRDVVDRRVGPNSEFRITEDDLKDIGTYGS